MFKSFLQQVQQLLNWEAYFIQFVCYLCLNHIAMGFHDLIKNAIFMESVRNQILYCLWMNYYYIVVWQFGEMSTMQIVLCILILNKKTGILAHLYWMLLDIWRFFQWCIFLLGFSLFLNMGFCGPFGTARRHY
jgi:hypothetical protein